MSDRVCLGCYINVCRLQIVGEVCFFFFFGLLRPGMEEIIELWLKALVEMMGSCFSWNAMKFEPLFVLDRISWVKSGSAGDGGMKLLYIYWNKVGAVYFHGRHHNVIRNQTRTFILDDCSSWFLEL